jgi:hydroxymethylbilane synthase
MVFKSQLIGFRPDVVINDLRGNVPTRIQKLRDGNYDAILLAKAGVDRLNLDLSEFEVVVLNPEEFVPAPAQGVLGLQIREKDQDLFELLQQLNDKDVQHQIEIERKVLNLLEGGCQLPLGVYCNSAYQVFVAYAKTWDEGASWFEYELEDLDQREFLPEMIVEDLLSASIEDVE